ncbi:hypothetical protein [Paraburkholderia acidisoli]|uniref:Uncharacterized protein n=1 Tax=Paraburkholderia acidisoli TaxID=2571748 RepID=A0A7Z2JHA8_9BURK|nr:hypothetical protein [Paraburkholderia acidisoli]QGZ65527.1 hypothetical protein FAZ98_27670 [Paraburkholderia acidisoli]
MTTEAPSLSLLRDTRYTMIPHRVRGVAAGRAALDLEARHDAQHPLQLRADGNAVQYNVLLAYTRSVTCVAALHCRDLLRFLGVQGDGAGNLRACDSSETAAMPDPPVGAISIDMFRTAAGEPLARMPLSAVNAFAEPPAVAHAWALTCDLASQPLAHAMRDPRWTSGLLAPALHRAFDTVPLALSQWFYERAVL